MNQLVAPTSFITSISRRRENTAVWIVKPMNSTARQAEHGGDHGQHDRHEVGDPLDRSDGVGGGHHPVDAGLLGELLDERVDDLRARGRSA